MSISYLRTCMSIQVYKRQVACLRYEHNLYLYFFSEHKCIAIFDNGSCPIVEESTCPFVMEKNAKNFLKNTKKYYIDRICHSCQVCIKVFYYLERY